MIVKNEEAIIGETLHAIPKELIDYWVISDTGSTDATKEIVQKELGSIPGQLGLHQWSSFGENKSLVLEAARGKSDFILLLDADHRLDLGTNNPSQIKDMIAQTTADQLLIKFPGPVEYRLPQLIRNNRVWKYVGVTHEYLDCESDPRLDHWRPVTRANFDGFQILDLACGFNRSHKFTRDAQLLEAYLKDHPGDPRSLYYLAQTYRDLGRLGDAAAYYSLRSRAGGFEEERWHARYQLARMEEATGHIAHCCVISYLEAFGQRPYRIEPLVHAIRLCRQNEWYGAGYQLGLAHQNSSSPDDLLFIEPAAYDWQFDFEFGICAFYAHEREVFKRTMEKVLASSAPAEYQAQARENLRCLMG
jgi:hypothetical protein